MPQNLRSILVDNETGACENLRLLLNKYCPTIELTALAHNTSEAEKLIQTKKPDLLFLDIEMQIALCLDFIKGS